MDKDLIQITEKEKYIIVSHSLLIVNHGVSGMDHVVKLSGAGSIILHCELGKIIWILILSSLEKRKDNTHLNAEFQE